MISLEQVEYMGEDDFQKVGMHTIGIRLKLKQACRNFMKGHLQSTVVNKFVELSQPKKKKGAARNSKRNANRNEKLTRRLYVGWKHQANAAQAFKVVTASKGGGQQTLDVPKDSSYSEVLKLICDIYFPQGYSKWQNLNLRDVTYFIGNFTGEPLPTMEGRFTLLKYLSQVSSSPVRLYLHTQTVIGTPEPLQSLSDDQEYDSNESLPSLADVMSTNTVSSGVTFELPAVATTQLSQPSAVVRAQPPQPPAVLTTQPQQPIALLTTQPQQPPAVVRAEPPQPLAVLTTQPPQSPAVLTTQPPQFITDSGTPEVTYHHRLSLRRRAVDISRPSSSSQRTVIDVVDSDDEELEMAIQASLQDYKATHVPETEKTSLDEILTHLYGRWVSDQRQTIIVTRTNVMESAFRALERKSFLLHGKPHIKFCGEIGEDYGGPKREFFRLALNELLCSQLFSGTETKYLNHDVDLLEKGRFRLAGQLIASYMMGQVHIFLIRLYSI